MIKLTIFFTINIQRSLNNASIFVLNFYSKHDIIKLVKIWLRQ